MPAEATRWRWASASKTGTSHLRNATRKQDAFQVAILPRHALCAIVSDGAGSASHGGQGASLVCRAMMQRFRTWFDTSDLMPDDEQVTFWFDELRDQLTTVAERRGLMRRDFAATVAALIIQGGEVLALQVGDSAIVGRSQREWEAICWPENGEFASTTFFVTDEIELRLKIVRQPLQHDAFAVFSDGIESIALEQMTQRPHARFFDPMIRPVDQSSETGKLSKLSAALGRYLESETVCDRTDDDKTLILLSGA